MSILIDEKTPIVVQGITGDKGTFHTKEMIGYPPLLVLDHLQGEQWIQDATLIYVNETVHGAQGICATKEAPPHEGEAGPQDRKIAI